MSQIPPQIGNYVALANCANAARDRIYPHTPVRTLVEAVITGLAKKVDARQISAADAALQMANLEYGLNQQAAQQAQAASAQLMSLGAGFGQAAMPSRVPVPLGAALGQAAGGQPFSNPLSQPEPPAFVMCSRFGPSSGTLSLRKGQILHGRSGRPLTPAPTPRLGIRPRISGRPNS